MNLFSYSYSDENHNYLPVQRNSNPRNMNLSINSVQNNPLQSFICAEHPFFEVH